MNLLFLRGQVPQDRNPQEIVFNRIKEVDDIWTLIAHELSKKLGYGEIWYWGGSREKKFSKCFIERWIPSFKTYKSIFTPDIIFCRGGFGEYNDILQRYPKAYTIYYGAGNRYLPDRDYNLILQDSPEQLDICKQKYPNIRSSLFIKPAPDNLFKPIDGIRKEFDICFPANGTQRFKGHDFVYSTVPKDMKVLNLGFKSKVKHPDNVMVKRVLRTAMAREMQRCSVGIVCCRHEPDSCPRVIPEMLACGLPIVVLNRVRFWSDKYIKSGISGEISSERNFWDIVRHVLDNQYLYKARKYYEENLSLKHSVNYLLRLIKT